MPDITTVALFLTAALGLLLIPGPAVLYIVGRGISQGRKAALVSVLGVGLGNLAHVLAATLGISALLVSSALAFTIVKYAGAAYLIYLGVRTILTRPSLHNNGVVPARLSRIFYQGFVVNLLNPKTALFFLAFLPQFVDPAKGAAGGQVLLFGCLFVVLAILSDGMYAFLSGSVGGWLRGNMRFLNFQRFFAGSIYIGLGVTTAFLGVEKK